MSRAAARADKESELGRVVSAKVQRYWAGKRPDASSEPQEDASTAVFLREAAPSVKRTPVAAAVVVKKADPRLARLARTSVSEARDEGVQRHRREVHAAEVVRRQRDDDSAQEAATALDHGEGADERGPRQNDAHTRAEEPSAEAVEEARQQRRQRALERQQAERAEAATQQQGGSDSSEDDGSEEDSEYESDGDEEEGRLAKPVFVAKSDRDTIAEKVRLEREEQQRWEADQKRKEERKKETSKLVAAIVDGENNAERNRVDGPTNNPSDIDTSDDEDEDQADFSAWQRRELARIKREQAMKDARLRDAAERERLANMTEAERSASAAQRAKEGKQGKGSLKFMQKYYHRGAFFQHEADDERGTVGGDTIYRRDFTGATGEDKFDKTALPAVMQVRNFGRAGRTKWKHLAAEDTSLQVPADAYADDYEDPFAGIQKKMEHKRAGMKQEFSKPTTTRT